MNRKSVRLTILETKMMHAIQRLFEEQEMISRQFVRRKTKGKSK